MSGQVISPLMRLPSAPLYLGWAEHNSKRSAGERMVSAVRAFRQRFNADPHELHCHPDDQDGIEDVTGTEVIGDGRARNVYLVGPVAEWQSVDATGGAA